MRWIKVNYKKMLICLFLIALNLGGTLLWMKTGQVYGQNKSLTLFGTVVEPSGATNVLTLGPTLTVRRTSFNTLRVSGFNSGNLGTINSVQVFFRIPGPNSIETNRTGTWSLIAENTGLGIRDTVATGTTQANQQPQILTGKTYTQNFNGQPWQWSDLSNLRLSMELDFATNNSSRFTVDCFYVVVNYAAQDTTPPVLSMSYFHDVGLTQPLELRDNTPVSNNKTVYVKVDSSKNLSEAKVNIDAPGSGNDVIGKDMTQSNGAWYYAWNIFSGQGDGLAKISIMGKDAVNPPNHGSITGTLLIDTSIARPTLTVTQGNSKVQLFWSVPDTETDLQQFILYKGTEPEFTPVPDKILQTFGASVVNYTDNNVVKDKTYYYKIIAVDNLGNQSNPSNEAMAVPFEDVTPPEFNVEYYTSAGFNEDSKLNYFEGKPITTARKVYLKITTNENLNTNPIITIAAPGVNSVSNQPTATVGDNVYSYTWNVQLGENVDGTCFVTITGEDKFGNGSVNKAPLTGAQVQIDTQINSPAWSEGFPKGGAGLVDLAWTMNDKDIKSYAIYRSLDSNFEVSESSLLLQLIKKKYRDASVEAPKQYYYRVMAIDYAGNTSLSEEGMAIPNSLNPHGSYTKDTGKCAECHQAHGAKAPSILKDKVKNVCYVCHDAGGQSILNVKVEMTDSSHHPVDLAGSNKPADSLSCVDCHNPHLSWDQTPALLTTRDNSVSGTPVCWTCHGDSAETIGDKKTNYPSPGSGHNNSGWVAINGSKPFAPDSGTEISCLGCHEEHGSSLGKLLRSIDWNNDGGFPTGNNNDFCFECHKNNLNETRENSWNGRDIFSSSGHSGSCKNCHEPHGTTFPRYLLKSYDTSNRGIDRNKAYSNNDFATCTICHNNLNNTTNPAEATGFVADKPDWPSSKKNLHNYHLNALSTLGKGNAVCKECHRPHGAISSENENQSKLIGFPSSTVSALTGLSGPIYQSSPAKGCTLVCHGVKHRAQNPQTGEILSSYE